MAVIALNAARQAEQVGERLTTACSRFSADCWTLSATRCDCLRRRPSTLVHGSSGLRRRNQTTGNDRHAANMPRSFIPAGTGTFDCCDRTVGWLQKRIQTNVAGEPRLTKGLGSKSFAGVAPDDAAICYYIRGCRQAGGHCDRHGDRRAWSTQGRKIVFRTFSKDQREIVRSNLAAAGIDLRDLAATSCAN